MAKEKQKSGMLLGFISLVIIFIVSFVGWLIEQPFKIGFHTYYGYITGIPLAIGICIVVFMTNKIKKQGKFNRPKFWLGFFMPFLIVFGLALLGFGACLIGGGFGL